MRCSQGPSLWVLGVAEATWASVPLATWPHADLVTYLAAVIVSLFNPERLQALPELFAVFRCLSDPTIVARTLCSFSISLMLLPTCLLTRTPLQVGSSGMARSTHVPCHGHAAAHRV